MATKPKPIGDVPEVVLERLQTQVQKLNRVRALINVTKACLEGGDFCSEVSDEVDSLEVALELLSDINHMIDPVSICAPDSIADGGDHA